MSIFVDSNYVLALMALLKQNGLSVPAEQHASEIAKRTSMVIPEKNLPRDGESLAVAQLTPKTAALAHDRILHIPIMVEYLPKSIGYFYASDADILLTTGSLISLYSKNDPLQIGDVLDMLKGSDHNTTLADSIIKTRVDYNRKHYNSFPTIYFTTPAACAAEFRAGPQQILTAALENIALVDEDSLTWEQVLEFRKDTEARAKYKRLVRWIDEELKSKSPAAVQDLIAVRLDDYEWSVKKHGMKTKLGALSCVLDPKFLAAASVVVGASTLAGGELWAALSAATVTIGGAAVSFGKSYIDSLDERRKDNYEVAYIHDIKKKVT